MSVPTSISSNQSNGAFAEEQSLKTLPGGPVWYGLEPNSWADTGAKLTSVARNPITNTRQHAKGTVVDLDATAGFNSDLTQRNLTRLLQGFFFADAIEKPATNKFNSAAIVVTAVASPANTYAAAAGLNAFLVNHLVFAKGFGLAANNGLKTVTTAVAALLTVSQALATEVAPPAGASIEAVGYQFPAGDLALTVVGATGVLTSAAITLTTLGLTIGEWIYVGGDGAGNAYAVCPRFFGRVKSISATQIIVDLVNAAVVADTGAAKTIQIFFGKVLMNAVLPANISRRSYQIERQLGSDGTDIQSEIVTGAIANEFVLDLKQAAKLAVDLSFVGMDAETRSGATGIKAGTRVAAPFEDAYNTSHDIVAMRIAVIDPASFNPTALFGYATEAKLTIKNGVVPNKALAVLGAFEASAGDFEVEGTVTAYFSTIAAAAAIRANSDVFFNVIMAKKNAGFIFDLPLLMLGDGLNKVEKDKPITTALTTAAAKNPNGYTALAVFYEYLPTAAMPA